MTIRYIPRNVERPERDEIEKDWYALEHRMWISNTMMRKLNFEMAHDVTIKHSRIIRFEDYKDAVLFSVKYGKN